MARLSTHVLDTARGIPAQRRDDRTVTDLHETARARVATRCRPTPMDERTQPLTLRRSSRNRRLRTDVSCGRLFSRSAGIAVSDPPFWMQMVIRFGVAEPGPQLSRAAAALAVRLQHVSGIVMDESCATKSIERCRQLAEYTEEPGFTTRTFLVRADARGSRGSARLDGAGRHERASRCRRKSARLLWLARRRMRRG